VVREQPPGDGVNDGLIHGGRPAGRLGTFETTVRAAGGTPGEEYLVTSGNLLSFLTADTNDLTTMILVWTEKNIGQDWGIPGQVPTGQGWKGNSRNGELNLATKENGQYAAPTLILELEPDQSAEIPESASMALLAIGGPGVLLKRRK